MNLEEEVSTETNHIEKLELRTDTDAGSNLSEKDKGKKRMDELSKIYKSRVSFFSILKVDFFSLESSPPSELKSPLIILEYIYLESSDTLLVPITSN